MSIEFYSNAFDLGSELADEYITEDVLPTMVRRAKRIVPVDTGALRSSIHGESDADGHFLVAGDDELVDYAVYVELGTSKMQAQPYLRPAASSALPPKSGG